MNIVCRNVPVLALMRESGEKIMPGMKMYRVKDFTYGLVMKDMETSSEYMTIKDFEALDAFPASAGRKIPSLPPMETWVNIRELGASGDGVTDDTKIFEKQSRSIRTYMFPRDGTTSPEPLK